MNIIKFKPVYQKRVWGGRALEEKLGRTLPDHQPYGESWEIVDRPEAQSVDERTGLTLRELLERDGEAIMGPGYDSSKPFPILVKWLDCSQRLSLQVHPPEEVARRLGGEAKTECWYIAHARDDAALIVGLKRGVTRTAFEAAIDEQALEPLLHRFNVQPGQAMLLESGRLHAIDAGNLILEIQQNSDTTYRVYDWGRKGLDGKPRQLHVKESLQSTDFEDIEPDPLQPFTESGERVIADCKDFRLRQINLQEGETLAFEGNEQPRILSLASGALDSEKGAQVSAAENVLIPYEASPSFEARKASTLLVTEKFT
ncbi:type I phosphomannose isomerase catalytic subunit [Wenzhouxiangella sediminis]|uniref:Mannose-6-phosphate isomerase n=1 Tax=Wenzhouxiangella sediminis TaxID=1792836 RepID=A0A3E1K7C6_9GAMM|nr:type I phosphomannose isomerase catalytic subunit [Wenzhouxiangella sediminis]RFF29584.1 mannose-6-phosphate isomerase [Wenzhouxiangella sediminis]